MKPEAFGCICDLDGFSRKISWGDNLSSKIPKAFFSSQFEFGRASRYKLSLSLTFRTPKHYLGVGCGVHESEMKRKRESPSTQVTSGKAGRFVRYLEDSCIRPSWRTVGCIRSWRLNMRQNEEVMRGRRETRYPGGAGGEEAQEAEEGWGHCPPCKLSRVTKQPENCPSLAPAAADFLLSLPSSPMYRSQQWWRTTFDV